MKIVTHYLSELSKGTTRLKIGCTLSPPRHIDHVLNYVFFPSVVKEHLMTSGS